MNNFPCKCGHIRRHHYPLDTKAIKAYCFSGLVGNTEKSCDCQKYIPDNLKYLEQVYDKTR